MRYELSDYEWTAIKPMLPNKPRGVRRVNDRRVLNGIFWVLRSGAPWRDLYGPYTTCYNRFVRWRQAGIWDQIMEALAAAHDGAVQMIDTSVVRVHQHGACVAGNREQHMGRSRGGLTSKIHAVVDANGLPVQLGLTPGEAHDNRLCPELLTGLQPQSMLLADRGYDADWIRALVSQQGAWANIPPKSNRKEPICFSPYLYRARNLVERFFNKIKQCRRIATRYDKLAAIWPSSNWPLSVSGYALMSPRPSPDDQLTEDQFWLLYWGAVPMVADDQVAAAVNHFEEVLCAPTPLSPEDRAVLLRNASMNLARACRKSLGFDGPLPTPAVKGPVETAAYGPSAKDLPSELAK